MAVIFVIKNYRFGFNVWGLILFTAIMLPNLIWFFVPAPNDILRSDSVTPHIDMIASICQALMTAALCVIINQKSKKISFSLLTVSTIICCLLYFVSWIFYYIGAVNVIVILGLTILPCLAFLIFALDRKNLFAVFFAFVFTILHLIYSAVNYIA